jgi:hypothetical protein
VCQHRDTHHSIIGKKKMANASKEVVIIGFPMPDGSVDRYYIEDGVTKPYNGEVIEYQDDDYADEEWRTEYEALKQQLRELGVNIDDKLTG